MGRPLRQGDGVAPGEALALLQGLLWSGDSDVLAGPCVQALALPVTDDARPDAETGLAETALQDVARVTRARARLAHADAVGVTVAIRGSHAARVARLRRAMGPMTQRAWPAADGAGVGAAGGRAAWEIFATRLPGQGRAFEAGPLDALAEAVAAAAGFPAEHVALRVEDICAPPGGHGAAARGGTLSGVGTMRSRGGAAAHSVSEGQEPSSSQVTRGAVRLTMLAGDETLDFQVLSCPRDLAAPSDSGQLYLPPASCGSRLALRCGARRLLARLTPALLGKSARARE
jgi:hypothetical protein